MPIKSQLWEAIIFHITLHNSYGKLKDFYQYPIAFISVQSFSMDFCNYIPTRSVCGYAYSLFKNPYRANLLCTDHFNFLQNYPTFPRVTYCCFSTNINPLPSSNKNFYTCLISVFQNCFQGMACPSRSPKNS